jgi:hypothetical protein
MLSFVLQRIGSVNKLSKFSFEMLTTYSIKLTLLLSNVKGTRQLTEAAIFGYN